MPVIFLTGRPDSLDELNGMLSGGDDYITKPFNPPILLARIAAVLKWTRKNKENEAALLKYKGAELDLAKAIVSFGGKTAELSKNEMKMLHLLIRRQGEIVPRADIIEIGRAHV